MKTVILLSSIHKEIGKCNSLELYDLIHKLKPDVIFEELCIDTFTDIYVNGYSPQSLEAKSVKKYIQDYAVRHFPVDTYKIDFSQLFGDYNIIAEKNPDYLNFFNDKLALIHQFGYSFINSQKCSEMSIEILRMEKATLEEINDVNLLQRYDTERELHNKREIQMLHNIYDYSEHLDYNTALFICGAEHRNQIFQKLPYFKENKKEKINWNFYEPPTPAPNSA